MCACVQVCTHIIVPSTEEDYSQSYLYISTHTWILSSNKSNCFNKMSFLIKGTRAPCRDISQGFCVLVAQSCLTHCDPMDCSPPGSSVHENFQARILEWVAFPFSRGSSQPRDQIWVSPMAGGFFTVWATSKDVQSLGRKDIRWTWNTLWGQRLGNAWKTIEPYQKDIEANWISYNEQIQNNLSKIEWSKNP